MLQLLEASYQESAGTGTRLVLLAFMSLSSGLKRDRNSPVRMTVSCRLRRARGSSKQTTFDSVAKRRSVWRTTYRVDAVSLGVCALRPVAGGPWPVRRFYLDADAFAESGGV